MKTKIFFLSTLILVFLSLNSCKDYLDFEPEGSVPAEGFFETPEHAMKAVTSIYAHFRSWEMVSFAFIIMQEVPSDNSVKGSESGDATFINDFDNFVYTPNQFILNDYWSGRYRGINLANQCITNIPNITMDEGLKARLIAEAKFLRGLLYFDLVRAFGAVPMPLSVPVGPEIYVRVSASEVWTQIETDFKDAASVLPATYIQTEKGRATSGAAKAMLAKAYLYNQRWAEAAQYASDVINSGVYSLENNFYNVFRVQSENGPESVFEIQAQEVSGNDGLSFCQHAEVQSVRGQFGWGFNVPTDDLAAAFDAAGDAVRKEVTILPKGYITPDGDEIKGVAKLEGVTSPRYNGKAYYPSSLQVFGPYGAGQNIRVMRYAEVLLIAAEAKIRQGDVSGAATYLNQVRQRVNLATIAAPSLEQILLERRLELAMEGDRFFDLVRTGQAATVLASKGFTAGKNELYPIPQTQIDLSEGKLTQNPGY